ANCWFVDSGTCFTSTPLSAGFGLPPYWELALSRTSEFLVQWSMTYAPLPNEWSRRYVDPESPPLSFALTSLESTTLPMVKVSTARNPCGLAVLGRLITTVDGSVALMLVSLICAMSVKRKAGDLFSLSTRWNEYTTSSAVIALPLANFAPDRSLKVMSHSVPESLISQLCARAGLMLERSAPSNFTSVSYALWASRTPVNSYATAGSSEIRSLVSAYQTSVLAAPPV